MFLWWSMNINIVCVGKIKEKFISDLIEEYKKRISKFANVNIYEVKDEITGNESINNIAKKKEAIKLLNYIKKEDYIISLCIDGEMKSSEEFASDISKIINSGYSSITFIIGGSVGLDSEIIENSNKKLSFSKMTFPHQLMRGILLEQIYRAFKINNNEPYHK